MSLLQLGKSYHLLHSLLFLTTTILLGVDIITPPALCVATTTVLRYEHQTFNERQNIDVDTTQYSKVVINDCNFMEGGLSIKTAMSSSPSQPPADLEIVIKDSIAQSLSINVFNNNKNNDGTPSSLGSILLLVQEVEVNGRSTFKFDTNSPVDATIENSVIGGNLAFYGSMDSSTLNFRDNQVGLVTSTTVVLDLQISPITNSTINVQNNTITTKRDDATALQITKSPTVEDSTIRLSGNTITAHSSGTAVSVHQNGPHLIFDNDNQLNGKLRLRYDTLENRRIDIPPTTTLVSVTATQMVGSQLVLHNLNINRFSFNSQNFTGSSVSITRCHFQTDGSLTVHQTNSVIAVDSSVFQYSLTFYGSMDSSTLDIRNSQAGWVSSRSVVLNLQISPITNSTINVQNNTITTKRDDATALQISAQSVFDSMIRLSGSTITAHSSGTAVSAYVRCSRTKVMMTGCTSSPLSHVNVKGGHVHLVNSEMPKLVIKFHWASSTTPVDHPFAVETRIDTSKIDELVVSAVESEKEQGINAAALKISRSVFSTFWDIDCMRGMLSIDRETQAPSSIQIENCGVDRMVSLQRVVEASTTTGGGVIKKALLSGLIVADGARLDIRRSTFSPTRSENLVFSQLTFEHGGSLNIDNCRFTESLAVGGTVTHATVCVSRSSFGSTSSEKGMKMNALRIVKSNFTVSHSSVGFVRSATLISDSSVLVVNSTLKALTLSPSLTSSEVVLVNMTQPVDQVMLGSSSSLLFAKEESVGNSVSLSGSVTHRRELPQDERGLVSRARSCVSPDPLPSSPTATLSQPRTTTPAFSPSVSRSTSISSSSPRSSTHAQSATNSLAGEPTPTVFDTTTNEGVGISTVVPSSMPSSTSAPETSAPTDVFTPEPTNKTPPSPPPDAEEEMKQDRQRDAKVTLMVGKALGDEASAQAVAATSASAVAVSAVLTPTAASQLSRVAAATQAVNCFMDEDDVRPSFFELPLQPAIGDGRFKFYAGGVLCASGIVTAPLLALCLVRFLAQKEWRKRGEVATNIILKRVMKACSTATTNGDAKTTLQRLLFMISIFSAVSLLYLTPNIVGGSVLLLVHGEGLDRGVAAAALVLLGGVVTFVSMHLTRRFGATASHQRGSSSSTTTSSSSGTSTSGGNNSTADDENTTEDTEDDDEEEKAGHATNKIEFVDVVSGSFFVLTFQTLFDGTRNHTNVPRRVYVLEELLSASVMAGLAGLRPGPDHCSKITSGILVTSILHATYVIGLTPMRTRLDHWFSVFFAVVQVVMGIGCVAATRIIESTGESSADTALTVVSVTVLIMFAGFFVQVLVQAYWAFHVFSRKQQREAQLRGEESSSSSGGDDDDDERGDQEKEREMLAVPLLGSNPTGNNDDEEESDAADGCHHSTSKKKKKQRNSNNEETAAATDARQHSNPLAYQ